MKTIYRYQLAVEDYPEVLMPQGAHILSVAASRSGNPGLVDLWALVNTDQPLAPRKFQVIGTGNPITDHPHPDDFIATVAIAGGALIWHVFERGRDRG